MSVILGIDIGGSTTKIVGLRPDGSHIAMHRVQAQDPITSLYGALGNFLFTNGLQLSDVDRIALTGVGASYVDGDIYGIPTEKVDEFAAVGTGGLALSGQEKAVVISMGTGTAFIWAERGEARCATCAAPAWGAAPWRGCAPGCAAPGSTPRSSSWPPEGDVNHIDLTVGDITRNSHPSLPLDITAANFGNVSDSATAGRLRRRGREHGPPVHRHHRRHGLPGLRLRDRGGSRASCPPCPRPRSASPSSPGSHGVHFIIPEDATFATSIGAALCSGKK